MRSTVYRPLLSSKTVSWVAAAVGALAAAAANAQESAAPSNPRDLQTVVIVGTPLPGPGVPVSQVPANVQSATSTDLHLARDTNLAEFMNRTLASVNINDAQANPFQPDVSFRGFAASPLLGNPIGLSVFIDGVRVNESFGDTVLWDLVPTAAISTLHLIPGSNPVFGLNTLGGALSLRTKSGRENPGATLELSGGSFGRRAAQLSAGGVTGSFDGFVAAEYYDEDGWRDRSPSRVRQLFGKGGWRSEASSLELTYTYARNHLVGNGLVPESLLAQRRASVYTYPDAVQPDLGFVTLSGRHAFNEQLDMTAGIYRRQLDVRAFNGDAQFNDGRTPLNPADDAYVAQNHLTRTQQVTTGTSLQLSYSAAAGSVHHRIAVGASRDHGRAMFQQLEQQARFTSDRGTLGEGNFALNTDVLGRNVYDGVFATDSMSFSERVHVTLSGRYNRAQIQIEDRSGTQPALNGNHVFSRFNPAAGVAVDVSPAITAYVGYNEGFRAPTAVELTCASPQDPCSLPVAFVADPRLNPVVAKSWELGVRSGADAPVTWNVSAYRTLLHDDVLFTSLGATRGFFANVPGTRRQGVEVAAAGRTAGFDWRVNYAFVEATFRSNVQLFNPVANPLDGTQPATLNVSAGDRLPGIPEHLLKLNLDYQVTPDLALGANLAYVSSQFLRGDDANTHAQLPGYTVVGARATYHFSNALQFFAKADNLFDREYATLGAFNRTAFDVRSQPLQGVGAGPVQSFVSPAAPRSFWVGVEYALGAR
jgi:iron complex outermembrane receptor protein